MARGAACLWNSDGRVVRLGEPVVLHRIALIGGRMNAQPTLFEAMQAPRNQREARFLAFHQANPVVYQLWDRFTREAIAKGHKRVGSQMIMERIRWETTINIIDARPDGEALKINDHHKPYYARLWMKNNPAHHGLFNTRSVEGDNE